MAHARARATAWQSAPRSDAQGRLRKLARHQGPAGPPRGAKPRLALDSEEAT